ncbi:uncharacterized protein EAE98_001121 [Botrytis deweyae]|uniref:Uncharacterized protein n=1 Tax=Botrytis deweyae TaxID=2478750 RepID=A0ABQ7J0L2_9HELO|nr:uncharacterized protein EAE98_001121 [Botrytis deweyae]KAF7938783.1 hypothetical protein EAE98_001121 [Botrytis deweyae]
MLAVYEGLLDFRTVNVQRLQGHSGAGHNASNVLRNPFLIHQPHVRDIFVCLGLLVTLLRIGDSAVK